MAANIKKRLIRALTAAAENSPNAKDIIKAAELVLILKGDLKVEDSPRISKALKELLG